jgi:hypothetical protein
MKTKPQKSVEGSIPSWLQLFAVPLLVMFCLSSLPVAPANAQTQILAEDFSSNALEDGPATTADWSAGSLKFPADIVELTGAFAAGSVSSSVDISSAVSTRALALGDLDGDGDLDIFFGNNGDNQVYFNNGFGAFTQGSSIPNLQDQGGRNTRSVQLADFNGDGHLDVLSAEFGGGPFNRILFNNGSGGPSIFDGEFVNLGPSSLSGDSTAVGDVDGDGHQDVVLGIEGNYVQLFLNDGFGRFSDPIPVVDVQAQGGFHARSVALGDLDLDGDLDLVAALETSTTSVYLNDGAGNFTFQESAGGGAVNFLGAPDSMALGDLNGDGYLDIVIGNDGSAPVDGQPNRVYINSTVVPGIFPTATAFETDQANTNGLILVDVDRDSDLDIVTADHIAVSDPDVNRLYLNDGTGTFAAAVSIGTDSNVTKAIAAGDLDGDDKVDLVTANDPNPAVAGSAVNRITLNAGADTAVNSVQLFATAASIQVDSGEALSDGVILTPSLVANAAAGIANPAFNYWMSADGGARWIAVRPGRSITFPASGLAQDLRWRVDMGTRSANANWLPSIDSVTIVTNRTARLISDPILTAEQGVEYIYNIDTNDPDDETVLVRVGEGTVLPTWLSLVVDASGNSSLVGTPTNDDVGTEGNDVTLEVVDGSRVVGSFRGTQAFTITVNDVNDPPAVVAPIADQVFDQGDLVNIDASVAFSDPDGDTLTYSAASLPAGLAIDSVTGIISGTLTNDDAINGPNYTVIVTADDGLGGTVDDDFLLTVNNINDAPAFASTPVTAAAAGSAYNYNITVEDIDGDAVAITAGTLPAWLSLTDNGDGTALLTGTPAAGDIGNVDVTVTADDTQAQTQQFFTIVIGAANVAPTITVTGDNPVEVEQGSAYTDAGATASDPEDGDLTSAIVTTDNVDTSAIGTYTVTYSVTDSGGLSANATRTVNVVAVNTAPTITITGSNPASVQQGSGYVDAGATASDAEDGDLTASVVVDSNVDTTTVGSYTVTYSVTDSGGLMATATRTVNVTAPPPPPPTPAPPSGGGGGGSLDLLFLLALASISSLVGARRRFGSRR